MLFDLNDPTAIEVISTYIKCAREKGQTIGLTSGSFDLIHFHHFLYLVRCRRECDVLIVGVDSDELARQRKGEGRPIIYDSRRVIDVVDHSSSTQLIQEAAKIIAQQKP